MKRLLLCPLVVLSGTNVKDPASYLAHGPAHPVKLTSTNSSWSPKPFSGYPDCKDYPAGGFYAKPPYRPAPGQSGNCVACWPAKPGGLITKTKLFNMQATWAATKGRPYL